MFKKIFTTFPDVKYSSLKIRDLVESILDSFQFRMMRENAK